MSYAYLDNRGSALRVLNETVGGFWNESGPATVPLSFAAERTERDISHTHFSWEIDSLNGSIEWPVGIDIERLFESPLFRATDRIVREALKLADVRVLNRAGVRLVCVEQFAEKTGRSARERVCEIAVPVFRDGLERTLGRTNDVAMVYEGKSDDGLGFRVQFGPYVRKNSEMAFAIKWGDASEPLGGNDLFFDIDIYETKLSFSEHSLFRWSSTKVAKAANFIEFCRKAH
ncbi:MULTISPECIES: hypothetical protein [unclassified Bradyrhizobium]|uniref:hypothetical protein n=1 Tax=unclassified Bradyrhizobium TaxID=2631580 RepID=UPI0028F169F7|nr:MULTISPECIES: hypothetical protein [unclassified Bradyrhizobium]